MADKSWAAAITAAGGSLPVSGLEEGGGTETGGQAAVVVEPWRAVTTGGVAGNFRRPTLMVSYLTESSSEVSSDSELVADSVATGEADRRDSAKRGV